MLNQNTLKSILTAGFTIAALSIATSQLNARPAQNTSTNSHPAASSRPATPSHPAAANRPATPSRPASTARPSSPATRPAAAGKAAQPTPVTAKTNTNINTNSNTNRNGNAAAAASRPAAARPATTKPSTTGPSTNNQTAGNVNKNTNINTNTNTNRNSNNSAQGAAAGNRTGSGKPVPSSTNTPANNQTAGNVNINKNTNININKNTNVNVNKNSNSNSYNGRARSGGGDVVRNHQIPDHHFRASFGRQHEFHLRRNVMVGAAPAFWFGGVSFRMGRPWPMTWVDTDPLYVDNINGAYFLCNRRFPAQMIPVDIAQCDACTAAAAPQPQECSECTASNNQDPSTPTVTRGMTIGQTIQILGSPKEVVDLGARKILLYDNMRVTFYAGRLIDIR